MLITMIPTKKYDKFDDFHYQDRIEKMPENRDESLREWEFGFG